MSDLMIARHWQSKQPDGAVRCQGTHAAQLVKKNATEQDMLEFAKVNSQYPDDVNIHQGKIFTRMNVNGAYGAFGSVTLFLE